MYVSIYFLFFFSEGKELSEAKVLRLHKGHNAALASATD